MKKTNFTSIQPSWCLGSNWLKGVLPLLALFAFMLPMQVHAQAPNCAHGISPSIDSDGNIVLQVDDLLTNSDVVDFAGMEVGIYVTIYNEWGGTINTGTAYDNMDAVVGDTDGDPSTYYLHGHNARLELNVCNYLGKDLEFSITHTSDGSCNQGKIVLNGTPAPQLISAFGDYIEDAGDLSGIPTAFVDTGLLVTYCGYVPDAEDHEPTVEVPCGGNYYGLSVQPDWIEVVHCNEESDTSEVIYRKWEVFNKEGDISTLTDTIVVLRLPMLTAESFVGYMEDTTFCEIEPLEEEGESVKRYAAWKQPLGIHDYEEAYSKLGGIVYELPATIVAAGLINAFFQGEDVWEEYLECVILKKADGEEITIGDIVGDVGGSPFDTDYWEYLEETTNATQLNYGFLHAIYKLGDLSVSDIVGVTPPLEYFPYLLLEKGDWVLSENGFYEQVTEDWFYNGNANSPYWFAGAWPSIYGSGDCIRYCDVATGEFGSCAVRMLVPELGEGDGEEGCVEICLDELDGNPHCGISIETESQEWAGACPATKGQDITVTQTCWGVTANECVWEDFDETTTVVDLEESDFASDKKKVAVLSQWLTLIDTIGPIFDFCYPEGTIFDGPNGGLDIVQNAELLDGCEKNECGDFQWYHATEEEYEENDNVWPEGSIQAAIVAGEQYPSAEGWEQCNPTVYTTGSHDCSADVYVPSVTLKDDCSGVHHVKAMVNGRAVLLERVSEADGFVTFAHTEDPISIPFQGHGNQIEVRYEAADSCWNLSEWYKYIEIKDATPPTVVVDDQVRVSLTNKVAWVNAETFDEGSWDNCGISLRLARRVDWWSDTACVDLCSNEKTYDNWVDLLVDLGFDEVQVEAILDGDVYCGDYDYDIEKLHEFFLEHEEVEAHYYEKLKWLWEDGQECGPMVVHGWLYDIARYVAENCGGTDEHGNPLDLEDLEGFFDRLVGVAGYGKEIAYLGGGWSKAVPFKCEDACEEPMVELLVMDYWCNWGKAWVLVDVEDKSQAEVSKELEDITISCEAYNLFYKDVVEEAAAYNAGGGSAADTSGAYTALDEAFGRYIKTWVNNQGQPTDIDGNVLPDSVLQFYYNTVVCEEKSITEKVADTLHDGKIDWITKVTKESYLDTISEHAYNGVIAVNCTATCEQDVWIDLDDCGYGTITRRFFIQGGCSDKAPEWEVEQVIHVEPACEVRLSMFDLPEDLGTKDEPVCIPSEDNIPTGGAYGDVALLPHLEGALCNAIAVGHEDKVSNVLGTDMKKIERVWSIKDWCKHDSEKTYTQVIIATVDENCDLGEGEDTTGVDTGDVSLTGVIATTASEEVEQVEVKAVLGSGSPLTTVTTGNGGYEFNIDGGSQVSLVPSKNTGHLNGLSVIDVVSIQSHVLQKNLLEGDYERIAADVDGDGGVDALDVLQLRKLIMTKDGQLANNTSWRFFVNDGTMKESFEIASLNENMNVDFVGVKVGDVDLSGDPSRSSRSNRATVNLSVADRAMKAGGTYRLDVTSENFENIAGMQYTLEYASSQVEIETIEAGALNYTKDHFVKAGAGVISSVWNEAKSEGVSLSSNEVLFTIVLKAKADVQLRDVLSLSDKFTMTEAATSDLEARNISLNFNGSENSFALYQNTPNPYAGKTVIGFNMPESSDAKLSVYDVTGKVLKVVEGTYNQGYNEVELLSSDLNTTGVLYYQLDTKTYTATKKMIVIE